jgi:hypothetical protein
MSRTRLFKVQVLRPIVALGPAKGFSLPSPHSQGYFGRLCVGRGPAVLQSPFTFSHPVHPPLRPTRWPTAPHLAPITGESVMRCSKLPERQPDATGARTHVPTRCCLSQKPHKALARLNVRLRWRGHALPAEPEAAKETTAPLAPIASQQPQQQAITAHSNSNDPSIAPPTPAAAAERSSACPPAAAAAAAIATTTTHVRNGGDSGSGGDNNTAASARPPLSSAAAAASAASPSTPSGHKAPAPPPPTAAASAGGKTNPSTTTDTQTHTGAAAVATVGSDATLVVDGQVTLWGKEDDRKILLVCSAFGDKEETFVYLASQLQRTPGHVRRRFEWLMERVSQARAGLV